LQADPPKAPGLLDLDCHGDDRLGRGLPAVDAGLNTPEVCLVDLDKTGERVAAGTHHRNAEAVQHRPRRLV